MIKPTSITALQTFFFMANTDSFARAARLDAALLIPLVGILASNKEQQEWESVVTGHYTTYPAAPEHDLLRWLPASSFDPRRRASTGRACNRSAARCYPLDVSPAS